MRWNNRTLRIFNDRMEQIALHARRERGFSTISDHIAPEKIHSIEKGVEFLLRKVRFIGQHAAQWAELLIRNAVSKHIDHFVGCSVCAASTTHRPSIALVIQLGAAEQPTIAP